MSGRRQGSGRLPTRLGPVWATVAFVVAACASTPTPPPSFPPTANPSAPATSSNRPSATPTGFDPARLAIRLDPVVDGLNSPLAVVNAGDGSDRLFVVEQPGRIRVVKAGALLDTPFLDIQRRIESGNEEGLLGLVFAPDFPTDPRLYVDYTDLDGNTVVASFRVPTATPEQADPDSQRILLHIDQPFPNHNGGGLAFGPDGDLYIGMGDGGSGGDPFGNGQHLTTLLGKILRIRPGPPDLTGPAYTIPPDNPFAGEPSAKPEIFAYGLRNPWRLSFDRTTGDLWIGDVGQDKWEEVDRWPAGAAWTNGPNFGWNITEGNHCYNATDCARAGIDFPVAEYDHGAGCAIIGGYVGRDQAEPALYGGYLYGDDCSGNIWVLDAARPESADPVLLLDSGHMISSFGEDEAGRLYLTDLASGTLLRIVPVP